MRKITLSFLTVALSLMLAAVAFAIDIPDISTWTQNMGVGGGGPGRGDVIISPLYDVRTLIDARLPGTPGTVAQEQFTLFSIVNTDSDFGVIGRLRFREWKRSRECLDIDIPLTTNDVWVGEVSRRPGGGAILHTPAGGGERWININRVTTPSAAFPFGYFQAALFPVEGFEFRTFDIEVEETDKLSRCEYGYIEFFGEERVAAPVTTSEPWRFPRIDVLTPPFGPIVNRGRDVLDVLMGTTTIVRPVQANSHSFNWTAMSDFAVCENGIWADTTTAAPNFLVSVQGNLLGIHGICANAGIGGFDQLEAIFSKRFIFGEYVTGIDPADVTATPMNTSWVVTFFTKHYHYDKTDSRHRSLFNGGAAEVSDPPFTGDRETLNDHLVSTAITACQVGENVRFRIYDRKENTFDPDTPISPTPDIPPGKLPWEVNIIGFYPLEAPPNPPYYRDNITQATAAAGRTFYTGFAILDLAFNFQGKDGIVFNFFGNFFGSYNGLPAIGLQMIEYYNDSVDGYFGDTVPWRYGVDWCVGPTC